MHQELGQQSCTTMRRERRKNLIEVTSSWQNAANRPEMDANYSRIEEG